MIILNLRDAYILRGRDLKQIKKWGRTKRKKGKVVIDKETGRKLITAITCVACFKVKPILFEKMKKIK